jgi:serine protease Do
VTVRTLLSKGSGFVVAAEGLVLTNAHVIVGARDIAVGLNDGRQLIASVLKIDERRDMALLKIEGGQFPFLRLRAGSPPLQGEPVLAFGAPVGLQQTVPRGIVSALRTPSEIGSSGNIAPDLKLLQTDAAINPGNSGGPLLDKYGYVVGLNSFKFRGGEGIGFAITAEEMRSLVDREAATELRK